MVTVLVGCSPSSDEGNRSEPATKITGPPAIPAEEPKLPDAEPSAPQQAATPPMPDVEPKIYPPLASHVDPPVDPPAEPAIEPTEPILAAAADPPGVVPQENPLRVPNPPVDPLPVQNEASPQEPHPSMKGSPEDSEEEKFDPIKENGPIFVDWPKPSMALVITGRQEGYIEPCGCAGLDRMKGGMSRRHSLFKDLRETRGWPVLGIDMGGQAKGYGRQAEMKFHIMVEGMRKMDYAAIGLGKTDLRLPAGELASDVASVDEDVQSPFLSANVALFGFEAQLTTRARVVKAENKRFGITSVVAESVRQQIRNDEIETADPVKALQSVTPLLKSRSDYMILLVYGSRDEAIALAKKFPDYHLVVASAVGDEPPATYSTIGDSNTVLVEIGKKGMDAIVLGMYADPKNPIRYQRVPLDSRFDASPQMKLLMQVYQDQLKAAGFVESTLSAVPHPQRELNGKFVGSKACESCHEESNDVWKRSGHAKAYDTLVELEVPRHFDPECISCHVIGWNPQKYFPYESGYRSIEKTPELIDVGCESCHGPGEAHCKAEEGSDMALWKKLRAAVRVTKEEAEAMCLNCHDLDNSPDFDFETYWPKVEHYESLDDDDEDGEDEDGENEDGGE